MPPCLPVAFMRMYDQQIEVHGQMFIEECSNMKEVIHWWNSRNRTKVMKMTVMKMMTSKLCHWTVVLTSTLEIHFF